jgi:hypothetical protein
MPVMSSACAETLVSAAREKRKSRSFFIKRIS